MTTKLNFIRCDEGVRVALSSGDVQAGQGALISLPTFTAIFPQVSLRKMYGEITVTLAQTRQLNASIPIAWVTYKPGPYGNIIVSLLNTPQELVINARAFQRITGVSERAVIGSLPVTRTIAEDIGFIIPPTETEALAYAAS